MCNKNDDELVKLITVAISYLEEFQNTFQSQEMRRKYLNVLNKIFEPELFTTLP